MSENFNLEIISPDQTLLKSEVNQVTIPAFEGLMTILKDHVSLVTFLRPGFIEVYLGEKINKYYVEDGTVEFFKNNLLILSSTAMNLKNLSDNLKDQLIKESEEKLSTVQVSDKERYVLSHKIDALRNIN